MKIFRKTIAFASALALAAALSACSTSQVTSQVTEVFDDLVEDTAEDAITVTPLPKTAITDPKTVDTNLAEPEFETNLKGSVTVARGESYPLEVLASSPDGGIVSYQWYRNNVNYNGGGSPITGAVDASYSVPASEVGTVYYYAVAINNHGDTCNMATSNTYEVNTVKDGEWQSDEFGKKYVNADGTYPVSIWIVIGGETYHFDSAGYATVGWLSGGKHFYYFDEEARLVRNGTTPDGFETDKNGRLVGSGVPELKPTAASLAAEAAAAAAAAAEQAAIEAEQAAQAEAAADESYEDEYVEEEYVEEEYYEEDSSGEEYYEEEYVEEDNGEYYEEEYYEEESSDEG